MPDKKKGIEGWPIALFALSMSGFAIMNCATGQRLDRANAQIDRVLDLAEKQDEANFRLYDQLVCANWWLDGTITDQMPFGERVSRFFPRKLTWRLGAGVEWEAIWVCGIKPTAMKPTDDEPHVLFVRLYDEEYKTVFEEAAIASPPPAKVAP